MRVFDPLHVRTLTVLEIEKLSNDLVHFEFPEFMQFFLARMKSEVGNLVALSQSDFDWIRLPVGRPYMTRS
jgi:hypothetical protein